MKRKGTKSVNIPECQKPTGQVPHGGAPTFGELKHAGQDNTTLQRMASSRRAKLKAHDTRLQRAKLKANDTRLQRGPDFSRRRSKRYQFMRNV